MLTPTVELYLFNVAIILIILSISFNPLYKGQLYPLSQRRNSALFTFVSVILLLLFLIFQFTETDFWSYWEMFIGREEQVEPLQNWIRGKFDNFFIWRFVVWGGALLLFILSFKRLGLNSRVYIPLFVLGYLSRFISREQLGVAIMFLGSTYFLKPLRLKGVSYGIGLLLILASYYFHSSMMVSIAMLIPAFVKVTSKRAILVLGFFVPIIYLFNYILGDESLMGVFADSSTNAADRIAIYTEQVTERMNFNGLIRQLVFWSPMILMLIDIIGRSSKKGDAVVLPYCFSYYLNYWFYLFVISFAFYWVSTSSFISVRFMDKSLFPMVIVLSYWFSIQKPNKLMKASLWLFLLYNALNYFLTIYKAL